MDNLRCIIADDEPLALALLESLVVRQQGLEVVAQCQNGIEALTAIRNTQPDLVFLDIEMPVLSGFDVIRRLQPEIMPAIIFTTAFNQYAIEAFDVHAVDYVLKPLSPERLELAVQRARLRLESNQKPEREVKASIMSAIEQLSQTDDAPESDLPHREVIEHVARPGRLLIRDAGKTHVIDPASIDWVDAAGDYMCIHVGPETLVARITMKKLEEQLNEKKFARIHRSTLVNAAKILKIENLGKGDCILHLDGEVTLKASRNYREHLMSLLV
jgi:two-component system LytT family response regulator